MPETPLRRNLRIWSPLLLAAVALIVYSTLVRDTLDPGLETDEAAVAEAFREGRSDLMVELTGTVDRLLTDDREGVRHQRFIMRLRSDQTLLVAHNIDLAERVPLEVGNAVRVRGEYEWSEQGGVLHWTHHDPRGRRLGGWIEHEGKRYE